MTWTDKQLNDAEEGIVKLAEATGLSDAEVVEILADGLAMKYRGTLPAETSELLDELRATFDAY